MIGAMRTSVLLLALLFAGCGDDGASASWEIVQEDRPEALLSIWGTSASDIWAVGADTRDGSGPVVLHHDGTSWTRRPTGQTGGVLWWVFGFAGGPVYTGGEGGVILRLDGDTFTPMTTPGTGTVFGIWGASPDDMWAVGGDSDARGGFAWRLRGDAWEPEPTLPMDVTESAAVWKVFGTSATDVWLVGSNGVSLHWDGSALSPGMTGVGSSLFTVHAAGGRFAAVGGLVSGFIVEYDGSAWHNVTPDDPPPQGLTGVCLLGPDSGIAVGNYGGIYERDASGWHEVDPGLFLAQNLHAVWIDPDGGTWAVGGQTFAAPLTDGVLIHRPPLGNRARGGP